MNDLIKKLTIGTQIIYAETMKEEQYDFNVEKNHLLKEERNISFEEVIAVIQNGGLLDVVSHPNQHKYPHQQIYVIDIDGYVYLVPFVRKDQENVFLKTIFKSRKMTKQYLSEKHGGNHHE